MAYEHNRKLINLLLQPLVQLRIGLVNVAFTIVFVAGLGWYAWDRLHQITEVIATLTEANEEITSLIGNYLTSVALVAVIAAVGFIILSLVTTVWMTHKLVGPTVAFRRLIAQLMDGKFGTRIVLRKNDAFTEVADDLNKLSEYLVQFKR